MRDKQRKDFASDEHEAELNDREMEYEKAIENDVIRFSAIPDAKPAIRPKSDDAKLLAMLKKTKLLPPNAELKALQDMLDRPQGDQRAKLLAELQSLPTTKQLQDTYRFMAYQLTFNDPDAASAPSLFTFHSAAVGA